MIAWMVHCVAVSLLLTAAAAAVEAALRATGRPTRGAWLGALALSLAIPALALLRPTPPAPGGGPVGWITMPELNLTVAEMVEASSSLAGVDAFLRFGWPIASGAVLLFLALSALRLHRMRGGWHPAEVDGTHVLLSRSTGPAVVGVVRGVIVVPGWVTAMPAEARRLLLAHEREHLRAGDVRLLAAAYLAVAAMPWNPVLWWQLRRLRLAIEVDCDARVLRRHPGIRAYGAALIDASRYASRGVFAMAAFTERHSTLERRIRIMTMPLPKHPARRAVALAAAALATLTAACELRPPTNPAPGPPPAASPAPAPTRSIGDAPAETPRTQDPRLDEEQRRALQLYLERNFPPELRAAGTAVRAVLWVFIDEQGRTGNTRIVQSSGHPSFDAVAQEALRTVTWTPARNREETVPVWIQLPVSFQVR